MNQFAKEIQMQVQIDRLTRERNELRKALEMIKNAPAPIDKHNFPRAFNRLRVIAGDALVNTEKETGR